MKVRLYAVDSPEDPVLTEVDDDDLGRLPSVGEYILLDGEEWYVKSVLHTPDEEYLTGSVAVEGPHPSPGVIP